jgi:hypothetical protein
MPGNDAHNTTFNFLLEFLLTPDGAFFAPVHEQRRKDDDKYYEVDASVQVVSPSLRRASEATVFVFSPLCTYVFVSMAISRIGRA